MAEHREIHFTASFRKALRELLKFSEGADIGDYLSAIAEEIEEQTFPHDIDYSLHNHVLKNAVLDRYGSKVVIRVKKNDDWVFKANPVTYFDPYGWHNIDEVPQEIKKAIGDDTVCVEADHPIGDFDVLGVDKWLDSEGFNFASLKSLGRGHYFKIIQPHTALLNFLERQGLYQKVNGKTFIKLTEASYKALEAEGVKSWENVLVASSSDFKPNFSGVTHNMWDFSVKVLGTAKHDDMGFYIFPMRWLADTTMPRGD